MTQEIEYAINGELIDNKVLIKDGKGIDELQKRGYGFKDDYYYLYLYEALYLMYINKLEVYKDGKEITFDQLVGIGLKYDENLWTKFLVYRDLRSRGYVAREGFGFGVDFRVYARGEYGSKPAKYVVFGLNEGRKVPVSNVGELIDQISKMGKEPVIAVIERRGEVIYYKISKIRFDKLKKFTLS
ncbi:MAG: tRNA-intron lyase [Candidatus Nitrosothermus koennekii]|nr:MAG: tRNA-intron lyase [Candidatus Nitrosothermus koennekii]